MRDFVQQYLLANSGTMVPKRFHMWSCMSLLAMTMGRKIFVDHKHYQIRPSLFITLVGRQALRKTSAKDAAKAGYAKKPEKVEPDEVFIPKSEFHYLLRLHVITLVEDCFTQFMGVKRLEGKDLEEWNRFKKILQKKL